MTAYTWDPNNGRMRSAAISLWDGTGSFAFPDNTNTTLWRRGPLGTITSFTLATSGLLSGFADATADQSSGVWMVQYQGNLVGYTSGGIQSHFATATGKVFNGVAYVPAFNQPYVVESSGQIYAGSGLVAVAGNGFGAPVYGLASSGQTLFSLGNGALSIYTLTSASSGTSGTSTYPFSTGMCLVASTAASAAAVGGWDPYVLPTGYASMAFASGNPVMVGLRPGVGQIDLYFGTNDVWVKQATVACGGSPTYAAWTPDGQQLLVVNMLAGVFVFSYAFGVLTQTQTISLGNVVNLDITPQNLALFVRAAPTNNMHIYGYSVASGWTPQTAIAITNPSCVLALGTTNPVCAVVGGTSGITYVHKSNVNVNWGIDRSVAVPFIPYALTQDYRGVVMACGTSGGAGKFAATSGTTVGPSGVFNFSWSGDASGIVSLQGQTIVSDAVNGQFQCFGNLFTNYQSIFAVPAIPNPHFLALSPYTSLSSGGTLFAMGTGSTFLYQLAAPFNVEPIRSGKIGIYKGGTWTVATLGSGHVPTALTFDGSNNIWAATLQNDLFEVALNGVVVGASAITQFAGQSQSTPLGISSMVFSGTGLFGVSSLAGPFVQLFP